MLIDIRVVHIFEEMLLKMIFCSIILLFLFLYLLDKWCSNNEILWLLIFNYKIMNFLYEKWPEFLVQCGAVRKCFNDFKMFKLPFFHKQNAPNFAKSLKKIDVFLVNCVYLLCSIP